MKIIEILSSNLTKHITGDIKCYSSIDSVKYLFKIKDCCIEILYFPADNFYRIKIENYHNNQLSGVTFLTKSNSFHKDIRKNLKENSLPKNSFENHIFCFASILNKGLEAFDSLNYLEKIYFPNLKFDGIFI